MRTVSAIFVCCLVLLFAAVVRGQSFQYFLTGDGADTVAMPLGGVCLMGGATENDQAMIWFLERAGGGDVVVLRASGSDGYNDYMMTLGPAVHSVETIVFTDASASYDAFVLERVAGAEAIWFAGGNQAVYVQYWRDTPVDSLIRARIRHDGIAIGGTSAGMAILGQYYFTAANGTITSSEALADPFDARITIDTQRFLAPPLLEGVITDTHFDDPDRRGRLFAFLTRIYKDTGQRALGIACDEYTAVCIDPEGQVQVFGEYPEYDDNAWFVQLHCRHAQPEPEVCSPGVPLTFDLAHDAVMALQVKGTLSGNEAFTLGQWPDATNGTWHHWYVQAGVFFQDVAPPPYCAPVTLVDGEAPRAAVHLRPQPDGWVVVSEGSPLVAVDTYDLTGRRFSGARGLHHHSWQLPLPPAGLWLVQVRTAAGALHVFRMVVTE